MREVLISKNTMKSGHNCFSGCRVAQARRKSNWIFNGRLRAFLLIFRSQRKQLRQKRASTLLANFSKKINRRVGSVSREPDSWRRPQRSWTVRRHDRLRTLPLQAAASRHGLWRGGRGGRKSRRRRPGGRPGEKTRIFVDSPPTRPLNSTLRPAMKKPKAANQRRRRFHARLSEKKKKRSMTLSKTPTGHPADNALRPLNDCPPPASRGAPGYSFPTRRQASKSRRLACPGPEPGARQL